MSRRLIVAPEAEAQIDAIDAWWRSNRPASPDLFAQELAAAFAWSAPLTIGIVAALSIAFIPSSALARPHMPPQYLGLSAGYGLSFAYERNEDVGGDGEGGYLSGEYYLKPSEWVSPRAYAS